MREVHGKRRVARWLVEIVGVGLGGIGLVFASAFLVLETDWGRGLLRDEIEARLDRTFVGGASVGRVTGNPLSELVLENVVINGPDRQPAIAIERLTVVVPLLPLISRQLRVDKIVADGVDVHARELASGDYQLAHLTRPSEKTTWSVVLPDVQVRRGHLRVDRGNGREPIDLDDVEVAIDARLPLTGPIDAAARMTGQWRQRKAALVAGGVVHVDDHVIAVTSASAQVAGVRAIALGLRVPRSAFAKPLAGTIAVYAPASAVRQLVPALELPGDVAVAVHARARGRLTDFSLAATAGDGELAAFGRADLQARLASLVVAATDLDLDRWTGGRLSGRAGALVALEVDGTSRGEWPAASGMVTLWARSGRAPPLDAVIAIDRRGDLARATIGVASGGGVRAGLGAVVRERGGVVTLERADLIAKTLDLEYATRGRAPVGGVLSANLRARGRLTPDPDLAITGHADGRDLFGERVRAGRLALRVDAAHLPSRPVGTASIELADVERGALRFAKLTVAAGSRPDGKLRVTVRSEPKPAPWRADVDALVTTGETIVVELQRHFVRAAAGSTWRGTGGRLAIGPREIALRGLRSTSASGHLAADVRYVRAGARQGDLTARVDVAVDLGSVVPRHAGRLALRADIARTGRRLAGTVVANATGVTLEPRSRVALDGDVRIDARDQRLVAHAAVATPRSGRVRLALDIAAPRDPTDLRAWRFLRRDAVRTARLWLDGVNLEEVARLAGAPAMTGTVDGVVDLTPTEPCGALALRDFQIEQLRDVGAIAADVCLSRDDTGLVRTTLAARLVPSPASAFAQDITQRGRARLLVDVAFMTPARIFDPAAWRRLGARAFRGGTVRADNLAFQPGTLERLGIASDLRGELAGAAELGEGLREVRFALNLHGLRGGVLARPVAVHLVGAVDDVAMRAKADVRANAVALLEVSAQLPVGIAALRAGPARVIAAPLAARVRIDQVPATTLMNVIGTSQITGGTLDGAIEIRGSLARPTADIRLVARDVTVPTDGAERIQHVRELAVVGTWDGRAGSIAVDGDETGGGKLTIRAAGSPDDLAGIRVSLHATKLEIAPLVAFVPGPAGGLAGRLDASLLLRGADPRTAELAGSLRITEGRIPIAPAIGTLFHGDVRVDVEDRVLGLRLTGKLGRGDVGLTAHAPLQGLSPQHGKLQLTVENVQLIGKTEPILTGVIDADVARIGETWRSNLRVTKMTVKIPEDKGSELAPVGAPDDLVYGGVAIHHGEHHGRDVRGPAKPGTEPSGIRAITRAGALARGREPPSGAALVAYVQLANVFVESEEVRGLLGGRLTIAIAHDRSIGIVGNVGLSRAVVELFDRRYRVDRALLHFDGSTDPGLDVRITHDFRDVTTITEVRGRLSNPQLILSSDPATYSQAELLGFLLGGEPGGAPEAAPSPSERIAGAGASIVGSAVGGFVKKALPVDLDVLRYEAATATTSAAITVGRWLTDTLFIAYRRRLDARPDENIGEGEVEYWLGSRLVIDAIAGDRNVDSADLLWRRRW